MSPVAEIQLLVGRELRRSMRSAKGVLLVLLTVLGALVAALAGGAAATSERALTERAAAAMIPPEAIAEAKRQLYVQISGDPALADALATVPLALIMILKVTVWLVPLLVALLGFDAVAGELQHRSVRFWTVRARRSSYFLGKMLGLWATAALLSLLLDAVADGIAVARGYATVGEALGWGLRFWLVAVLIAGVWGALATLVSSRFRAPILALLVTFAVFFVLWLFGLGGFFARLGERLEGAPAPAGGMSWYEYLYPNAYDAMLASADGLRVLTGAAILGGATAALAAAGAALFARRDL
jgi:ABC-type transport system involved in multi-copper enzyme maturation permease subunit